MLFNLAKTSSRCAVYSRASSAFLWTARRSISQILRLNYRGKEMSSSRPTNPDKKSKLRSLLDTNQPIDWYLDWDGTITKRDTLDALVNISAQQNTDVDVHKVWPELGRKYMEDAKSLFEEIMKQPPATVDDEKEFLKVMEAVEIRSVDRVSSSGIFKGLVPQDIIQGAKRAVEREDVQIRRGYKEFVDSIVARASGNGNSPDDSHNRAKTGDVIPRKDLFTIISVNWSARFIEECMRAAEILPSTQQINLQICANELENITPNTIPEQRSKPSSTSTSPHPDKESQPTPPPSTGHIIPSPSTPSRILFSRDKLHLFSQTSAPNEKGDPVPRIYIGDSWTDFECLLAADLGICIRDEPMTEAQRKLEDSFRRVGIRCCWLLDLVDRSEGEVGMEEGCVVWVRDFGEINVWLEGGERAEIGIE